MMAVMSPEHLPVTFIFIVNQNIVIWNQMLLMMAFVIVVMVLMSGEDLFYQMRINCQKKDQMFIFRHVLIDAMIMIWKKKLKKIQNIKEKN